MDSRLTLAEQAIFCGAIALRFDYEGTVHSVRITPKRKPVSRVALTEARNWRGTPLAEDATLMRISLVRSDDSLVDVTDDFLACGARLLAESDEFYRLYYTFDEPEAPTLEEAALPEPTFTAADLQAARNEAYAAGRAAARAEMAALLAA